MAVDLHKTCALLGCIPDKVYAVMDQRVVILLTEEMPDLIEEVKSLRSDIAAARAEIAEHRASIKCK